MSFHRGRRYHRYEPPEPSASEVRANERNKKFHTALSRFSKNLVRISSEEGLALGLNPNFVKMTRMMTLVDPKTGSPEGALSRAPGIGLWESTGIGGYWYVREGTLKRLAAKQLPTAQKDYVKRTIKELSLRARGFR